MKIFLSIFALMTIVFLTGFTEVSHPEHAVTLQYEYTIETDPMYVTTLEITFNVQNDLNYDVKALNLSIDIYLDDVFVERFVTTLETDVIHRSYQTLDYDRTFNMTEFNRIEIASFSIVQATFFQTYSGTIFMGVFFSIVLFVMWMIGDINRGLILSEVNEILIDHWWKVLIITLLLPLLINLLIYFGRSQILSTLFGWVFFITAILSTITFYGILMLYHYIDGR